MTAVSASARTTGLALKAIPSPAASIMSRSLAPSPMATVRASGSPSSAANSRRAAAFAGPVHHLAENSAGQFPSTISKVLARAWSMPNSSAKGWTTSMKPPETTATVKPRR